MYFQITQMSAEKHIPNIYSQDKTTQHSGTHTNGERERERERERQCVCCTEQNTCRENLLLFIALSLSLSLSLSFTLYFNLFQKIVLSFLSLSLIYCVHCSLLRKRNTYYMQRERERERESREAWKICGDEVKKWRNNGYINDGWAAHYAQQQCHC